MTPSRADAAGAVALGGMLAAAAAVLGAVEASLLPGSMIPGVRLGLANVPLIVAVMFLRPRASLAVAACKVIATGLATGALFGPAGAMSAAGALVAWGAVIFLRATGRFSALGFGIGASAGHVLAQYVSASLLVGSAAPLVLLPIALAVSVLTGATTGYLSGLVASYVPLGMVRRAMEGERGWLTFAEGAGAHGRSS